MKNILNNDWQQLLQDEFEKDYYQNLRRFLISEYKSKTIYPDMNDIFNALKFTAYKDVKVVILGKILITDQIKLTVFLFLLIRELRFPLL